MNGKIPIIYVTSSKHKRDENAELLRSCALNDGTPVSDLFEFELREARIKELLEIDLAAMVCAEVVEAYCQLKLPCVVEHAGLIFEDYRTAMYPGGLTKPMWNALGDQFVTETHAAGRRAIARAVVAYCDGQEVKTFVGEVKGHIAAAPTGSRTFYWDTVFIPDDNTGAQGTRTYAEIVDDPSLGLRHKVSISQSTKAMLSFLEYRRRSGTPHFWEGVAP